MATTNWTGRVEALFCQQVAEWGLACKNYAGLHAVLTRSFQFDGFRMQVQCNPERMLSTAANVDAKAIAERPCFLCVGNLPAQQKGLNYVADHHYVLLVNPFPIFSKHLTIPDVQHTPQRIAARVGDMLQLARDLPHYTLFYNGPQCGASAPDHFHFQAGSKGLLPIEGEWRTFKGLRLVREAGAHTEWAMDGYLRQVIILQGSDSDSLARIVEKRIDSLPLVNIELEPMLNLMASYENRQWTVFLFPRKKHRPRQFFETGEQQIVFSPASVDMGGLMIAPRKEDYLKLTSEMVSDMFEQVSGQ